MTLPSPRSALVTVLLSCSLVGGGDRVVPDDVGSAVRASLEAMENVWRQRDSYNPPEAFEGELGRRYEEEAVKLEEFGEAAVVELARLLELLRTGTPGYAKDTCKVATLLGVVGRKNEVAAKYLISSVPMPERSEDICVVGGLVDMGPSAYDALVQCALNSGSRVRAYYCALALVAQTVETSFPEEIGLGSGTQWDQEFPTSRGGIRRVTREWKEWWQEHESELVWNPNTSKLEPK